MDLGEASTSVVKKKACCHRYSDSGDPTACPLWPQMSILLRDKISIKIGSLCPLISFPCRSYISLSPAAQENSILPLTPEGE